MIQAPGSEIKFALTIMVNSHKATFPYLNGSITFLCGANQIGIELVLYTFL